LYTSDEETGSATARPLFEREAKRADYALVFEPARGENGIITARKGCALGSLTVEGREAHALSAYLSGADANLALAKAVVAVCEAGDPAAGRFFNFGTISGGRHADIVSDKAEGRFFVTFSDDEELALIKRTLEIAVASPGAPGCRLASTLDVSFPPLVPTPMSRAAYERVKTLGAALGLELPEQSSPGSSDGCWVASHGVPVIDALGPYMYDIHTTREAARISSFPERTALFGAIIATMADWPIRASKTGA
jgi:glutamate carboxypeptidase